MRVALFTESFLPKVDGVVNTLSHVLRHLNRRGHSGLLFAPAGGPDSYAGAPVVGLPGLRAPLYREMRLAPPWASVSEHLDRFRPDLIHVVNPFSLGVAGLREARRRRLPVVASYHTDLPGFATHWGLQALKGLLWRWLRWLHNQADLNLCPSRYTQAELEAHGFNRVRVWGRGVDTQRFSPTRRSREWRRRLSGGHPRRPLLLYVGRLSPEKRVDWLRPLLAGLPSARLAIVGDGPARPALERKFAGAPALFTGYLHGDDLAQAYASADVFVFPAANETLGNVVLEAMASGLPVIAPRSGGPLDHLTHGETGLLFAPDNQVEMVALTARLVYNRDEAARLGRAARRHAEARGWEAALDGLLEDYAEVIAARASVTAASPRPQAARRPAGLQHRLSAK